MVEKKQKKNGYPARFFFVVNISDDFPLWLTGPLLMIFNVSEKEIPFHQPLTLYLHCFHYYYLSMVRSQKLILMISINNNNVCY